jgi:hypothetical protein
VSRFERTLRPAAVPPRAQLRNAPQTPPYPPSLYRPAVGLHGCNGCVVSLLPPPPLRPAPRPIPPLPPAPDPGVPTNVTPDVICDSVSELARMASAALLALFVYMNFKRMGTDLPSDEATLVFSTIGRHWAQAPPTGLAWGGGAGAAVQLRLKWASKMHGRAGRPARRPCQPSVRGVRHPSGAGHPPPRAHPQSAAPG